MSNNSEKIKEKINKKFGRNIVLSGDDDRFKLKRIPTGILSLDILLNGGIPMSRWFEIYGQFSTLKTSIACYGIAECQRMGFPAVYCDVERSITKDFLEFRGVDTSPHMLDVIQADTGEEYIEAAKAYLDGGEHKVIVIDSIAAMLPNREKKMEFNKEPMGAGGMLTSRMTRVLTAANKSNACLIMVNQTREKLQAFGDNTTTPGGRAPKFYAGQSLKLTRIKNERSKDKEGEKRVLSQQIVATLEKDKTSPNMGRQTTIFYDVTKHSVDHPQEALGLGLQYGIIKRRGNTYIYRKKEYDKNDILERFGRPKSLKRVQRDIIKEAIT